MESMAGLEASGDLRDYLRPLRRHLLLIAVCGLAFIVLAFALIKPGPRMFSAQSKVLVGAGIVGNVTLGGAEKLDLITEQNVVTSSVVADPVRSALDSTDPVSKVLSKVTVTNLRDSKILVISYSDRDAAMAQKGAQAFADEYLAYRTKTLTDEVAKRKTELTAQATDLKAELDDANAVVSQTEPGSAAQNAAVSQRDALQSQVNSANQSLFALNGATVQPGTIIQPAVLPLESRNSPRTERLLYMAAALAAGLVIGAALAFILDALDNRIASGDTVRLGIPVLGFISLVRGWRKAGTPQLGMEKPPSPGHTSRLWGGRARAAQDGMVVEDLRAMRADFLFLAQESDARLILLTSARDGDGKSTVAANLAVGLAALDRSVILISADLWVPTLHETFGLAQTPGLVEATSNDLPLSEVLQNTGISGLQVVTTTAHRVGQADLLGGLTMHRLLAEARHLADHVIIDGAPLVVADSLTLAGMVDAVILVADARTPKHVFNEGVDKLESAGATIMGAVINRYDPKGSRRSYSSYYTYHSQWSDQALRANRASPVGPAAASAGASTAPTGGSTRS